MALLSAHFAFVKLSEGAFRSLILCMCAVVFFLLLLITLVLLMNVNKVTYPLVKEPLKREPSNEKIVSRSDAALLKLYSFWVYTYGDNIYRNNDKFQKCTQFPRNVSLYYNEQTFQVCFQTGKGLQYLTAMMSFVLFVLLLYSKLFLSLIFLWETL
jgi:hypothetical protein